MDADAVDWYVYHQANALMLKVSCGQKRYSIGEDLGVGNGGNRQHGFLLDPHRHPAQYVEAGKIRPGHRLVLLGFGVGYSSERAPSRGRRTKELTAVDNIVFFFPFRETEMKTQDFLNKLCPTLAGRRTA